jgi:hypothetical protein
VSGCGRGWRQGRGKVCWQRRHWHEVAGGRCPCYEHITIRAFVLRLAMAAWPDSLTAFSTGKLLKLDLGGLACGESGEGGLWRTVAVLFGHAAHAHGSETGAARQAASDPPRPLPTRGGCCAVRLHPVAGKQSQSQSTRAPERQSTTAPQLRAEQRAAHQDKPPDGPSSHDGPSAKPALSQVPCPGDQRPATGDQLPPCTAYPLPLSPIGPAAAEMTGTPVHHPLVRPACVRHASLSASGRYNLPMLHPATLHRHLCCLLPAHPHPHRHQRSTLDSQTAPWPVCSLVRACHLPASRLRATGTPSARQARRHPTPDRLRRVRIVGSARMTSLMQSIRVSSLLILPIH